MKKCSKCLKDKTLNYFNKDQSTKDGYGTYCKECRKDIRHKSYLKNKDSIILSQLSKRRKSQDWVRQFKTECKHCGETHPATLDFHHLENKEHGIGNLVNRNHLTDEIKRLILIEINKCIVLCSNCHRKLHWDQTRNTAHTGNAPVSQP